MPSPVDPYIIQPLPPSDFSLLTLAQAVSLLTSEYKSAPRLIAWLTACLQPLSDICALLQTMDADFLVNDAIGNQLDFIGQIVDAPRILPFSPTGGHSALLDDDTYRLLLKATIGKNQWDGKIESLYALWDSLFPGGQIYITDNQDMSFSVLLAGSFTDLIQQIIQKGLLLPRPEGVLMNVTFVTLPILGFDLDTSFIGGFDKGHWA